LLIKKYVFTSPDKNNIKINLARRRQYLSNACLYSVKFY